MLYIYILLMIWEPSKCCRKMEEHFNAEIWIPWAYNNKHYWDFWIWQEYYYYFPVFCFDHLSLQTEVKSSKNTFRIVFMLINFGHSIIGFMPQLFQYYKLRFHWASKSLIFSAVLPRESLKLWKFFQ